MIMWAVKSPFEEYYFSIKCRRSEAITNFVSNSGMYRNTEWRRWKRKGYKCVKVKIQELERLNA